MSIAELEATIRASRSHDAIAIYADHLQTIGDPRGELVAIDLRIDDGDAGADMLARRAELIEQWFGAALPAGIVRYGFVDADASGMGPDSQLAAVLRGPGARFIRTVTLAGPHDEIAPALRELAAESRPWLTALTIRHWAERPEPLLDLADTTQLFANLPALRSLVLEGRRILSGHSHPTVEQLRITGFDAIDLTAAAPWPRLRALDFAFHCQYAADHRDPPIATISELLVPHLLPALTSLDLSRNEPGHTEPRSLGGSILIGAFFARFARHPSLATVQLPALRHAAAIESVERTLALLPALREVSVWAPTPRMPKHPTATIREIPIEAAPPGPKRLA